MQNASVDNRNKMQSQYNNLVSSLEENALLFEENYPKERQERMVALCNEHIENALDEYEKELWLNRKRQLLTD